MALAAARQAVLLDPNLAKAQAALGEVLYRARLDFPGARAAFDRALATGGGDANILAKVGDFESSAGDLAGGTRQLARAATLDPLNPAVRLLLGISLYNSGRFPEAITQLRRALALSPRMSAAHAAIGDCLVMQGRYDDAAREYALEPTGFLRQTGLAILRHKQGDQAGAQRAFAAVAGDRSAVTDYQQAQILAQWGRADEAIAALDAAFRDRDSGLANLAADRMLDPLRGDARLRDRLARLGLTQRPAATAPPP
jgi:tetratricopeptide (TPR) repeat protein